MSQTRECCRLPEPPATGDGRQNAAVACCGASCKRTATLLAVVCLAWLMIAWGCRTAPISGRQQVLLIPEAQEVEMGRSAYEEILKNETASTNRQYVEMVERVGRRIAAVAGRPDYNWEFRVIASDAPNAFCLPGGKVAFYEGILPICRNEAGVAVVMAHEIAHALARHGGERMTQDIAVTTAKKVGDIVLAKHDVEQARRQQIMQVYGVATEYGAVLPFSRKQESEADEIGLMLMAKAGYDPAEAVLFWHRFGELKSGQQTPEFLSTHPSDERRAAALENLLPQAEAEYRAAPVKHGIGETVTADKLQANTIGDRTVSR